MSSILPSINGHGPHTNGTTSNGELKNSDIHSVDSDVNSPSTSFSHVNESPGLTYHDEAIVQHLYHFGFQAGNYNDTVLHVHQNKYRLHAIILSRSPFLAHLLSTSPQTGGQHLIHVHLEHEPEITPEGFAIALGYLYSSVSLRLIRPENARAVLAAGCLLGGMDDLCAYAYNACKSAMSVDTISEWIDFVAASSHAEGSPISSTPLFHQYAERLRDDVFHFLVVTLPGFLEVTPTPVEQVKSIDGSSGRDTLLRVYSRVPFELFKAAVESPKFQIGSDQTRFKFAKDAIELRKHGVARGSGEETVVLAFGGGSSGAVHIARKLRRRPLWKVHS